MLQRIDLLTMKFRAVESATRLDNCTPPHYPVSHRIAETTGLRGKTVMKYESIYGIFPDYSLRSQASNKSLYPVISPFLLMVCGLKIVDVYYFETCVIVFAYYV